MQHKLMTLRIFKIQLYQETPQKSIYNTVVLCHYRYVMYKKIEQYQKECLSFFAFTKDIGQKHIASADRVFTVSDSCQVTFYQSEKSMVFFIVPSILNSPEIFFINNGSSFIDNLKEFGSVYLINWIQVDNIEHDIEDYIKDAELALRSVLKTQSNQVNLIGHCLGGNILLGINAEMQNTASSITLLTTPWDFSHFRSNLLATGIFDKIILELPKVPKMYTNMLFFMAFQDEFKSKIDRYFDTKNTENKSIFFEIEHWIISGNEVTPTTYKKLKQVITSGRFVTRNLQQIHVPVLLVGAQSDKLVPINSILPLQKLLKNSTLLTMQGGHIKYFIEKDSRSFFEKFKPWIEEISCEMFT